ncbi:unnamed protein product [Nippostrongylus brasiliensis]|uniref:Transcriptional regulator n=1 Tax=Nippostrongylus brasiliensis TaxID=27835 RepID=A0A0N4YV21_NIPBR|nr:unnamed protein product [Nippostrongylus brasiliensis]
MSGAACPVETRRAALLLIRDEMRMGALLLGREEQHYCEVEQDDWMIVGKCCWQQLDSTTFRSLITAAEKLPLLLLLVGQHLNGRLLPPWQVLPSNWSCKTAQLRRNSPPTVRGTSEKYKT